MGVYAAQAAQAGFTLESLFPEATLTVVTGGEAAARAAEAIENLVAEAIDAE